MRHFTEVAMPSNIALLPLDKRGYPVPYIVQRDIHGLPVFTMNDAEKHAECLKKKKCPICGLRLSKELWFVGGPLSAFHPHGCYYDSAMHHECMTYALKVCPYLALRNFNSTPLEKKLPHLQARVPGKLVMDPTMEPGKPAGGYFVAVMAYGQTIEQEGVMRHQKPLRPYHKVEFWKDGTQVSLQDGIAAARQIPELDIDGALRLVLRAEEVGA